MIRFGALEAGGTKMVLSLMSEEGEMLERVSMPTLTPAETMPKMIAFFKERNISALGIVCFGPVDLNPASPTYGYITSTPKLAWRNYPIVPEFKAALNVPVKLDTDVNGAAIAEHALGAAKGLSSCVYVTVGTGIGGGVRPPRWRRFGRVRPSADARHCGRSHARGILPLSQGLLGGCRQRPRPAKALGLPCGGAAARASRVGVGGWVSGADVHERHGDPLPGVNHSGRRRDAAEAFVPADPQKDVGAAGRLCTAPGGGERLGGLHC